MDAFKILTFLPLLFYGIALSDLLKEWKRLLDIKNIFLPYAMFTVILTETALYNVFIYKDIVHQFNGLGYMRYLTYLIPPFLFMLTVNIFTPDKDEETKGHFIKQMPRFFALFGLFVACHFLYDFGESATVSVFRIVVVAMIIIVGFLRKVWPVYVFGVLWLFSLLLKFGLF